MKQKFYIATAIVYSSKKPHIGNDYELIYADAIARFKRLSGYDVFFLTGTDEHGQKIEEIAKEAGITPKESTDKVTGIIRSTYDRLGISYDKFIRTTDDYHEEAVKKIFTKLYENGDIYKGLYEGLYCVPCESLYTPSQIEKEGICPDCGGKLNESKEEAYLLNLSKYQDKLAKYIEENEGFLSPIQRKREIVNNFINPGLHPLCVSRSTVKWGVPVEFDPEHVVYVWIDALSNYITALGYNPEKDMEQEELYKKYAPCDLHVIGKDIMRFHAIYMPVIWWGLGLEQPKQILGHPWLLTNDEKMSKSKGNVIYTDDLIDKFGVDPVRYYVLSVIPFDRDGSFTYENFIKKYNSDLANTLSNLVNRTIVMTEKYFGGTIPAPNNEQPPDGDLKETAISKAGNYAALMNEYKVSDAVGEILELLYRANKYIDETEPWTLGNNPENYKAKTDRLATVLYNLLEIIRISAVMLSPIIPETSEKILEQLGNENKSNASFESIFEFGGLKSDGKINKTAPVYLRLDDKKTLSEIYGG